MRKFVAPEFIFGMDARRLTGQYAANMGARKVLLVTDPGVMAAGWTGQVLESIAAAGLESAVYSGVTSNPKAEEVMRGAEMYRREECNAIVAVGGGSPMDCAKGIGIVSAHDRPIIEFSGVDTVTAPTPPLICVPTTAGTAADVSQFAIITDAATRTKLAIISKILVPDVALIDPITTTTMPPDLTACTGMDALCHAVESYVSTAHSPITDVHALAAARLVAENLLQAVERPQDMLRRGAMMLASLQAGLAFSNASLGAVHAMAHSLGGLLDSPHGESNAVLLPHVVEANFSAAPVRYRQLGIALGIDASVMAGREAGRALVRCLKELAGRAGVSHSLGDLGISRGDIPELARKAINDPCIFTNPRMLDRREIEAIYEKAF